MTTNIRTQYVSMNTQCPMSTNEPVQNTITSQTSIKTYLTAIAPTLPAVNDFGTMPEDLLNALTAELTCHPGESNCTDPDYAWL